MISINNPGECVHILSRFLADQEFQVVVLLGTGENPRLEEDAAAVRSALVRLGCEF